MSTEVQDPNLAFVDRANPHAWLLTADDLHSQAKHLCSQRGRGTITLLNCASGKTETWDNVNRSIFLLGGFALENAIKAFLVFENPHWVSNGRLSRNLRSHSLIRLQRQSEQIPYKRRYLWVLRGFEDGLNSWARYPCEMSIRDTAKLGLINDRLWGGYIRLMRAYGNKMTKLLRYEGWTGPHGFSGHWSIGNDFLAMSE